MDGSMKLIDGNVSANYTNWGEAPFAGAWKEQTGVTVDFLHPPAGQSNEQFNLLMADGKLPE